MFKVENISEKNDIIIGKNTLRPGGSILLDNLEPLRKAISLGYIEVTKVNDKDIYDNFIKTESPQVNFDLISKEDLTESFFNYHLNQASEKDLFVLKTFYKYICFTNKVDIKTLSLLDDISCSEELTEVLLNNVYPKFLELFFNEIKEKNK